MTSGVDLELTVCGVVVLGPVKEWIVDDGVRSLEDPERYNYFLRGLLHELEIPYIEIGQETKDLRARVELVVNQTANYII